MYLRVAAGSGLVVALALVAAVGTPGQGRTRHVALGPEAPRVALAEAEHAVAAHRGAHHGAPPLAGVAVVACGRGGVWAINRVLFAVS